MVEKQQGGLYPIFPLMFISVLIVFIFFGVPYIMDRVQSESGMCGKEFHGGITYISSLKTDKNIEGSFFFGTGGIHTERVYVVYIGDNKNGYTLIERPISESILYEDTNDNPYVEEVTINICTGYGFEMIKKYKFHVPEGTIKMEYDV